ncbi:thiol-disulfide isomerase [Aquincola sp. S2]|uniref:Thiol-disulfide isomerase n=1 Tax=Pseudaquabacterium terrae TaxID=2732868 RepID=A0ABX2EQZ4_9BURK|nr:circadian clock KaiB family protein [Aquabacterium terrae]NRF71105.1 thiol-disulfide isomerase [Aquabacterium terrae]
MSDRLEPTATQAFEHALEDDAAAAYVLRLYVTGATERSAHAIANLRAACEQHLAGRYELEVIDVYQEPLLALQGRILAAPTLVKDAPPPVRRLIGDLSDRVRLFAALDIRSR